jgi:hypothetical protein
MQFEISCVCACALASASFAGLTSLHGVGPVAEGVYASSDFTGQPWVLGFSFDGPLDGAATDSDFGDWSFTMSNGANHWTISGTGAESGTWRNVGSNRIFTITLMSGASAGSSTLSPAPTEVSIVYTATRAAGSWGTLGAALAASQGTNFDASRGGFMVKTGSAGAPSAGSVSSGYSFVPAPGALSLIGAAGLLARKRRQPDAGSSHHA